MWVNLTLDTGAGMLTVPQLELARVVKDGSVKSAVGKDGLAIVLLGNGAEFSLDVRCAGNDKVVDEQLFSKTNLN